MTRTSGEIVYGCMGLGGDGDEAVDRAERSVHAALDIGITVFDHADIYGGGTAESVFGAVLARNPGLRDRITLQTKCGIRLGEDGLDVHYDLGGAAIVERVEQSLRRLGVEHVDVLLLHRPDPLMEPEEVAAASESLHRAGKIGALGVSNMSAAQITLLQAALDRPIVANQLEMSLAVRDWVEQGILVNHRGAGAYEFPEGTVEHCRLHGIGLQAWGALAQGRFTGAGRTAADEETAAVVRAVAEECGSSPEAVVLGWLMRDPAGISPVVGTTDPDRIAACADASRVGAELTRTQWWRLFTAARGENAP